MLRAEGRAPMLASLATLGGKGGLWTGVTGCVVATRSAPDSVDGEMISGLCPPPVPTRLRVGYAAKSSWWMRLGEVNRVTNEQGG